MSRKFLLFLYYSLPLAIFGQTVVAPNRASAEFAPFGLGYYPQNNIFVPGRLHFPADWNFIYDSYQHNSGFPESDDFATQGGEAFSQYGEEYSRPLGWKEGFGQPVYREPLSLTSM